MPLSKNKKPLTTYKKKHIPQALREQVWINRCGEAFGRKCLTTWCNNKITVFDFHCGHNIPEVKGGKTTVDNLVPICTRCNLSMSSTYTFEEWCAVFQKVDISGNNSSASNNDWGGAKEVPVGISGVRWWCC